MKSKNRKAKEKWFWREILNDIVYLRRRLRADFEIRLRAHGNIFEYFHKRFRLSFFDASLLRSEEKYLQRTVSN